MAISNRPVSVAGGTVVPTRLLWPLFRFWRLQREPHRHYSDGKTAYAVTGDATSYTVVPINLATNIPGIPISVSVDATGVAVTP